MNSRFNAKTKLHNDRISWEVLKRENENEYNMELSTLIITRRRAAQAFSGM